MSTIQDLPFLYVNGLQMTWSSTSTITISAGQCRDATNSMDINVGNYLGLDSSTQPNVSTILDITRTGLNALDQGTVAASTMYYIYVIDDSTEYNPGGFILSTSNVAPLMPQGPNGSSYDKLRLIGAWATDSSSDLVEGYYSGNGSEKTFMYATSQVVLASGTDDTYTPVDLTTVLPNLSKVPVYLYINFTPGVAGDNTFIRMPGTTIDLPDANVIVSGVSATAAQKFSSVLTLSEQQEISSVLSPSIDYAVTTGATLTQLGVQGFILNL